MSKTKPMHELTKQSGLLVIFIGFAVLIISLQLPQPTNIPLIISLILIVIGIILYILLQRMME
jgi:multisubunit Na+/H+ antiporter MnhG subunit